MSKQERVAFEFGPFRLIVAERLLLRNGKRIRLPEKSFELLVALVRRSGSLVHKDELLNEVWPDTNVEEGNISRRVHALRRALGDDEQGHTYIETVQGQGYRFTAPVTAIADSTSSELVIEKHTRSHIRIEEQIEPDGTDPDAVQRTATNVVTIPREHSTHPAVAALPAATKQRFPRTLIMFAIAAIVVVAFVYFVKFARKPIAQTATDSSQSPQSPTVVKSIAVLPLKTLGATDAEDEYLSVGLTDALITRMANVRQIRVLPTSAVLRYAGNTSGARSVGLTLGVDAVLEGEVQRQGTGLRFTMQLVSVQDGATLWAAKFDETQANIFHLQDDISQRVVEGLALKLSGEERERLARRDTTNTEAYRSYLKGRYYWNRRTDEGIKLAVEHFNAAINYDPLYALAYAGLADSYLLMSEYNVTSPRNSYPKAVASARRALDLDEKLAEAHTSLAYALANYEWNFAEAEKEYRRAIELNPNYATAHQWYAEYLSAMERFAEAHSEIERARELDPLSSIISSVAGLIRFHAREFDRAIEQERQTILMDPTFAPAHAYLGLTYEQTKRYDQAVVEWQKFFALVGVAEKTLNAMQQTYAQSGYDGYLRMILAGVESQSKQKYVAPFERAFLYARLKDRDKTMEWLQKTYEERQRYVIYLRVDGDFDFLRGDPRMVAMLKNIGLSAS